MDDSTRGLPHWTHTTPGVTEPPRSKRDSTISLEDPYLTARQHHANSQQRGPPSSPPAQQHCKPALGLLVPQEVYNYEPSPITSPDIECPGQRTESSVIDPAHQGSSPLQKYLSKPDNGELVALGLPSSNMALEQLTLPFTAAGGSMGAPLCSSSTKGSSWDMVESGASASYEPPYTDFHVTFTCERGNSMLLSDWNVVESPSTIDFTSATPPDPTSATPPDPTSATPPDPSSARHVLQQTISADASMSLCNDRIVPRSRMRSLVTQAADLEVDPLVISTDEPSVALAEAYLQQGRRNRSSQSSSQVSHSLWPTCTGADSL